MTIQKAIQKHREGIKRKKMSDWLRVDNNSFYVGVFGTIPYAMTKEDILATDWEVC